MEKRVLFRSRWLPWVLLLPQLAIVGVFFFWPASQAILQSVQMEDAFGMSREFVGLENFERLWNDSSYLASFQVTALFSVLVAGIGIVAWAAGSAVVGASLTLAGVGSMAAAALVLFLSSPDKRPAAVKQGTLPLLAVVVLVLAFAL